MDSSRHPLTLDRGRVVASTLGGDPAPADIAAAVERAEGRDDERWLRAWQVEDED